MAIVRMDNVSIVVEDLAAAVAFFTDLGMELEGEAPVAGRAVDRLLGLDNVRTDVAMMRPPDGHGGVELTKFHSPTAVSAGLDRAAVNALGMGRIMFAVDDIDEVVARLCSHGADLVGDVVQYEQSYRLAYIRGPEGIVVALAQQIG